MFVETRDGAQKHFQMSSHWNNPYDTFKDRRYGALFLGTFLALMGLLALGGMMAAIIGRFDLPVYFLPILPGVGLLAAAWIWRRIRQERAQQRERLRRGPLSRDELRVARSKLMKGQNRKKS